jgi:hypothetical protein
MTAMFMMITMMTIMITKIIKNKKTPWTKSASELFRPSDRRMSVK